MKIPKKTSRYCPYCRKQTEQKIKLISSGGKRGALTRGSIQRAKKRGLGVGIGNKGRWGSKPAKPKRTGAKSSKTLNLKLTCLVCKKSIIRTGRRTKKVELV